MSFETAAWRVIEEHTNSLLNDLDRLAGWHGVDKHAVQAACEQGFGPDLADAWADYIAEADL